MRHESEWNGGEGCSGMEEVAISSTDKHCGYGLLTLFKSVR